MGIKVAVKAKHPTRRAIDKVLYTDANLLDIVEIEAARQILSLLDTAQVALYVDEKYYPVDEDNYAEQFELALKEEELTVEEDAEFGIKKLTSFVKPLEVTDDLKKFQDGVEAYNNVIRGTSFLVDDYEKLGNDKITKNGYWLAFGFDKAGAEAEGYSELKFFVSQEDVADENYVFLGKDAAQAYAALVSIIGKFTPEAEEGSEEEPEVEEVKYNFDLKVKMVEREIINKGPEAEESEKVYHTVTFDPSQGLEPFSVQVEDGQPVEKPEDPVDSGVTFNGWFEDDDLTIAYDFSKPVTSDFTLYADWA